MEQERISLSGTAVAGVSTMSAEWYYQIEGDARGPVGPNELKELVLIGKVAAGTPVRDGEAGEWQRADRVPGLFDRLGSPARVTSRLQTVSAPRSERRNQRQRRRQRLLLAGVGLIALGLAVAVARDVWWRAPGPADTAVTPTEAAPTTLAERRANPLTRVVPTPAGGIDEYAYYVDDGGAEVRHGPAARKYASGQLELSGQWFDGRREGLWFAYWPTGMKRFQGAFEADKPTGGWSYWDEAGALAGLRSQMAKDGPWREWNRAASVLHVGEYRAGRKVGRWAQYKLAPPRDGNPVTESDADLLAVAEFKADVLHGEFVVYAAGKPRFTYSFAHGRELPDQRERIRGQLAGDPVPPIPVELLDVGARQAGPFDPPEPLLTYWSAGRPKASGWTHGIVLTGEYRSWYPSGVIEREGRMQDNRPVGKWMFWAEDGAKRANLDFDSRTARTWQPDGKNAAGDFESLTRTLMHGLP